MNEKLILGNIKICKRPSAILAKNKNPTAPYIRPRHTLATASPLPAPALPLSSALSPNLRLTEESSALQLL